MVLFWYNYTLSICNCCHKMSNSPSCAFMTSFSSESEIKSLSRLSPGHSSGSSGLFKKIHLMSKTCSIQIESYTLLAKVCRKFTTNFSSKRKPQFQVIFGQDSFPLNTSSFLARLSQNSANCLLTNGWCNTWFYHYSFYTKVSYLFLLTKAWFVLRYFSFVYQIVLVVFFDYFLVNLAKYPVLFFICLQIVAFGYFHYDIAIDISE